MRKEEKLDITICPNCGAEMKRTARYCMKCGYLNLEHGANESMKPFVKEQADPYEVGSGKFMIDSKNKETLKSIATKTGDKRVCFLVNLGVYLFSLFVAFLFTSKGSFDLTSILESFFPLSVIIISIIFLYVYSFELIFMKCNRPWWAALIPVYSMMILSEVLYQKRWIGALTVIPIIGQIVFFVMLYKLNKCFDYEGILPLLLFPIFIPLMGFGVHAFMRHIFVNKDDDGLTVEQEYKLTKIFFMILVIFLLAGVGSLVFTNFVSIAGNTEKYSNYYYVYASKRLVSKVKKKIEADNVVCNGDITIHYEGDFYFQYSDVRSVVYLPFYLLRDVIKGYVHVVSTEDGYEYYVSVSDGTKGFEETRYEDVNLDTVISYPPIVFEEEPNMNICKFID